MDGSQILLLVVFTPLVGALFLPLVGRASVPARNVVALALVLTSLVGALALVPTVFGGTEVTFRHDLALGVNLLLVADRLAVFMALVSSLVGAVIVFYSWSYIGHYGHQSEYFLVVVLFLGAMMGLVFSQNLILLYVFWEITAIACWRLIGFYRERAFVLKADKAFLVTVFGALVMLIGFLLLQGEGGSFDLPVLRRTFAGRPIPDLAVGLILVGILAKSATLPLHTWLPDAGVAPSPVTALLHAAVLVKIGVYVFARLFGATFEVSEVWHVVVPWVAGTSALVSAGAALVETDIKRIIAYSTVSQIGFIFLGLSVGNDLGMAGGLLYILMHGLSKGGLFLCAGIVEQNTHEKDIRRLGGLGRTMPVTAVAFLLCSFSVMGLPPFGGFFAKYMVIGGAMQSGQVGLTLLFLAGALLTILYLLRVFTMVFLGQPQGATPREGSRGMVGSVALLAALSLLGGVWVSPSAWLVQSTVVNLLAAAR
jgi:proton-translocating NADH-quinone oxidoreductase chain N